MRGRWTDARKRGGSSPVSRATVFGRLRPHGPGKSATATLRPHMTGARQTWVRHRLAVALMPLATVAVHQLRYVFAYGAGAGHQLVLDGDGYVTALLPGLGLLALAAAVLEVVLGSAHTSIIGQAFADGGLWILPAAVLVGFGWSLAVRGSRAVLALALRRALRRRRRGAVVLAVPRGRSSSLRVDPGPLARRLAGRAPPLVTS